jgi:hypothetical protein
MSRRCIIVHFHFFKNAGSSVEYLLEQQFGADFERFEPGAPTETFPATVLEPMLENNQQLRALSSHTICFPLPSRPDWSVFPVVFLRHPLDRILSVYNFERKQDSQNPGAIAAKTHGLGDYIEALLATPHERALCNYQAWMLADHSADIADDDALLQAALKTSNRLPVVGVVDEFAESVRRLTQWLSPYFPGLDLQPVRYNRTSPVLSQLDERIDGLRKSIGNRLFERIESENSVDFELYRMARQRLLETGV